MKRFLLRVVGAASALVVGASLFGAGCDSPPLPPPPDGHQYLIRLGAPIALGPDTVTQAHDQIAAQQLGFAVSEVSARIGDENDQASAWYDAWLDLLKQALVDSVHGYPVTYLARNVAGERVPQTGMLYVPKRRIFDPRPYPVSLIAYPHGTELRRDRVPSNNDGDEWVFGAAAALFAGYAVAMPDLPGMGGDTSTYHPYCHAESLAYSVADMIRAVQEAFGWELSREYSWDGRLYILGYSEGGYAAMATVRELQLHAEEYDGLKITGSACMAPPVDLTGAMRQMMIDPNRRFSRPFFLPYIILGYHGVYPTRAFDPNVSIRPILMPDLLTWMDGQLSGSDADLLIEQRMGVDQVVPRDMLAPEWVAGQLEDGVYETSEVGRILAANNLWSGWAPGRPMLLMQSPDDECVPYANSEKAYSAFVAAGAGDLVRFYAIGNPGQGVSHVAGAVIGIPSAIMWFRHECPKD